MLHLGHIIISPSSLSIGILCQNFIIALGKSKQNLYF
nr:MAG TPA: hypothetical protein [Caudoviricetes sp.]DAT19945.1 MAG TPA: hypothetical protein [Bacteriophage sp.]